MIKKKMLFYLV